MALADDRRRRIASVASTWRVRMSEPASAEEIDEFEAWINQDPEHARAYAAIDAISETGAQLPRRMLRDHVAARPKSSSIWAMRPAFALSLAASLLAVGALWFTNGGSEAAHAALSNDGPAIRAFKLGDGSAVILDRRTALEVNFRPASREITLQKGRARFRVAPAADRPFTVVSADARVTATGTLFDVARDGRETIVLVLAGSVSVSADDTGGPGASQTTLHPGEAVGVDDGRLAKRVVDDGMRRWPDGRVAFLSVPLGDVVQYINRRGPGQIVLADPGLARLTVTAVLDLRDSPALARKLAATFGLRAAKSADSITTISR